MPAVLGEPGRNPWPRSNPGSSAEKKRYRKVKGTGRGRTEAHRRFNVTDVKGKYETMRIYVQDHQGQETCCGVQAGRFVSPGMGWQDILQQEKAHVINGFQADTIIVP